MITANSKIFKKRSIITDFSVLVVVITVIIFTILAWQIHNVQSSLIEKKLSDRSDLLEQFLDGKIHHAYGMLNYMGREIKENTESPCSEDMSFITGLFRSFSSDPIVRDFIPESMTGWADCQHKSNIGGNDDLSEMPHIKRTTQMPWQMHMGRPVMDKTSGEMVIPAAVGITGKNGEYLGALVIAFNLHSLKKSFSDLIKEENTTFGLIDDESSNVLTELSSHEENAANHLGTKHKLHHDTGVKIDGVSELVKFGIGSSYYLTAIEGMGYTLSLHHSNPMSMSAIGKIAKDHWAGISATFIICFMVILYLRLMVIGPYVRLAQIAKRIARRKYTNIDFPKSPYKEVIGMTMAIILNKVLKRKDRRVQIILHQALNVTEYAREEAERISQLKTKFMSQIVHDIVSPLSSTLGFAEMLKNGKIYDKLTEKQQEVVGDMHDAMQHVIGIAHEMLETSEMELENKKLKDETVNIKEIIDESIRYIAGKAEVSGIRVVFFSDGSADMNMRSERRYLLRIITNILSNSVKYSGSGTTITVSTEFDGKYYTIKVRDEGQGIEDVEKALKPFSKLDSARKTNVQSYGIGLYNVKQMVVDMHGGKIEIESVVGEGTCVYLMFPAKRIV